jgi:hypothetical protein
MKKLFHFKPFLLLAVIVAAALLLQAYSVPKFDDNNPNIDRPTQEAYSHFNGPHQVPDKDVVTDATGFDNFNISIDNYEMQASTNPNSPLQIFFGVNGGSSQNAWNTSNAGLN